MEGPLGLLNNLKKTNKTKATCKVNINSWITRNVHIHICAYHFVASTDKNGYRPGVFTLLDDQHAILGGTKGDLLHQTGQAKFLWCQLTEPGYDSTSCSYGNQLQEGQNTKNAIKATPLHANIL